MELTLTGALVTAIVSMAGVIVYQEKRRVDADKEWGEKETKRIELDREAIRAQQRSADLIENLTNIIRQTIK